MLGARPGNLCEKGIMWLSAAWLVQVPEQYRAVLAHGMLGARPLPRALQIPMPLPPPPQLVAATTTTSPAGGMTG